MGFAVGLGRYVILSVVPLTSNRRMRRRWRKRFPFQAIFHLRRRFASSPSVIVGLAAPAGLH